MELKEVFDAALEKFRREKEERERRERKIEEFLDYVYRKLHRDEAAIINPLSGKTRIIIANDWIGIEDPSKEDPSLPPMDGFTYIPKSGEKYREYKRGLFGEILIKAIENPEEAKIEVIEVSPGIIAKPYIDNFLRYQLQTSDSP